MTDVVGESNYFKSLAVCYHDAQAIDCDGGKVIDVKLIKEPNNPYDKNAVGVYTIHGQIGHLSRQNALKFNRAVAGDYALIVKCRIYSSDPTSGVFGAWLAIDLDKPLQINTPTPPELPKPAKKRKLFGLF